MSGRTQPCVLIVDDDDDLRELIAEHLTREGFIVAQAPTGADALDRLKAFAYDGLVIDLKLPDADGLDILNAAMTRYPEVVAVVMTGFGGVEEAVAAIKRGAIDFFIKPVQLAQLSRVLAAAINEPRLRQENAELRAQLRDRYRFDNIDRPKRRDAAGVPEPRAGGADEQHRADSGRDRHRQGTHRADHSPQQPARRPAIRRLQRRRHSRAAGRGRTVRPRQGRLHRRHRQPGRTLRAGASRHALHRRSRADEHVAAGQAPARAAGTRDRTRRRIAAHQVRRAASSPRPTWN